MTESSRKDQDGALLERGEINWGLTRRTFLGGMAVATGAAALGPELLANPMASSHLNLPRPRLGALYEPSATLGRRYWRGIREIPQIGHYELRHAALDTHVNWAKAYGMDFFLVSYRGGKDQAYQTVPIEKLFHRTERGRRLKLAFILRPDVHSDRILKTRAAGKASPRATEEQLARWILDRCQLFESERGWTDRKSYLSDESGRKVLAVSELGDLQTTLGALEKASRQRPDLMKTYSIWIGGTQGADRAQARLKRWLSRSGGTFFVLDPLAERGWQHSFNLYERLAPASHTRVVTVSPSYRPAKGKRPRQATPRDGGRRLREQLAELKTLTRRPQVVLVSSFNDWHSMSSIEPSVSEGSRYLQLLKAWKTA